MAPAGVAAVDANVAALVLADDVATSGHDRLQHHAAPAVGVFDVELAAQTGERRRQRRVDRGRGDRIGTRRIELGPTADDADLIRPHTARWRRRAQRFDQLGVVVLFVGVVVARACIEEPGALREVDRRRGRQPTDDFACEVALDLLWLELAHELLQQRTRVAALRAIDADRGQHEAVVIGDRQMQSHMAHDEVLELVADRGDQRCVGPEVLGFGQRGVGRLAARPAGCRRRESRLARREVPTHDDAVDAMDAVEDPRFERHDLVLRVRDFDRLSPNGWGFVFGEGFDSRSEPCPERVEGSARTG